MRELRGKGLAPSASLEVDGVVLVPAGAGSSEAATREVEGRLGMDREAFHTTVVAQQGELSRLADAKPADRKRLLLRMLGIDRVERAVEEARSRRNVVALALEKIRAILPDVAALDAHATAAARNTIAAQEQSRVQAAAAAGAGVAASQARTAADVEEKAAVAARERAFHLATLRAEESHREQAVARLQPELALANQAAERAAGLAPLSAAVEPREEAVRVATFADAARGQHTERLRSISRQREAVGRLQAEVAAITVPPDETAVVQGSRAGLVTIESTLQMQSNELAVLESRWTELEERRKRLQTLGPHAPCPTCERPLNGQFEHLHAAVALTTEGLLARRREASDTVAALRREADLARITLESSTRRMTEAQRVAARRADLERRMADEARRLADLEGTLGPEPAPAPDVAALRAAALEARRAREDLARLQGIASRAPTLAAQLAEAAQALATTRGAREALETSALPYDEALLMQARHARDAALVAHQRAERQAHETQLLAQRSESEAAAAAVRLDDARRTAAQAQTLEGDLLVWNGLVGRAGGGLLDRFRDHLVGRVGPAISAEASRLLSAFTAGRYTEILLDEDYQVFVTDHGVPYALERFSGGEADLVHLALRLAVSRLLAERGGVELRFLALDEVFGSLDRERREHVVAALQGLGTLYSQVLVVTHLDGLQESLGQALRVVEGDEGQAELAAQ